MIKIKIQLSSNFICCLKNPQKFPMLNILCGDILDDIFDENKYLDTLHLRVPNVKNLIDDYVQNISDKEYEKKVKIFLTLMPKYSDIFCII